MSELITNEQAELIIAKLKAGTDDGRMHWQVDNTDNSRFTLRWGSFWYELSSLDGDGSIPYVLEIAGTGDFSKIPPQQFFSHRTDEFGESFYVNALGEEIRELYLAARTRALGLDEVLSTLMRELDLKADPNEPPF